MANLISFDKLNENDFFLGRRSFCSNKWELCKVVSIIPKFNDFRDKFIHIRFLDGYEKNIFIHSDNSCSDNFGEDVLREVSQQIDIKINKLNKLRKDISEIENELNLLGHVI